MEPSDTPPHIEQHSSSRDTLVAAALDCIVTIDADGCVVEFNPAAESAFGFTREEILGRDLGDLILPPEHRDAHRAGLKRFQIDHRSRIIGKRLHLEALRKTGERFPVELTVTAYVNSEGGEEFTAFIRDLTERELERIRREEVARQLAQVTEHIEGVIALLEWPSAKLLMMSGAFGRSFDLPDDSFAADPLVWASLVATEHRELIRPLAERDPEIETLDVEVRRARGKSWLRVRAHPVLGDSGRVVRLVVQTESITARKAVENTLAQTKFVLEKAGDAIFLMGRDARFEYVNDAATRMLGWSRDELLGMTVFQIDSMMKPEMWPGHWADLEEAGTMVLGSVHRHMSGAEFPVEVTVNYTEFDGVPFNCAVVRDVSERMTAEAAKKSALEQAQSEQKYTEALLSNLGHELRTPLASVTGNLDAILQQPSDASAVQRMATSAREGCGRLIQVVDAALSLSGLEAGRVHIDNKPTKLMETLQGVIEQHKGEAASRGLGLQLTVIGAVPVSVVLDPRWLAEAVHQLVSNAVRYTPSGEVNVEVSATPSSLGAHVRIDVIDSGPGLEQDRIEAAFGHFVRLGPNAKGVDEGLGVGLPLAREAIAAIGGELQIRTAPGRGMCATVELDVELADIEAWARAEVQATAYSRASDGQIDGKILLVEDAPELAELYRNWLLGWGLEVHSVADGGAALAAIGSQEFDLALMDIRLPVLDGLEVARESRSSGSFTPIIAMSAQEQAGLRDECYQAGCSAFLPKPLDRSMLHGCLLKYLQPSAHGAKLKLAASDRGEDSWLGRLRRRFRQGLKSEVEELAHAVDCDDRVEAKRLAHRLKGTAQTFDFAEIAAAALVIESLDPASDLWQAKASGQVQVLLQYC